MFVVLEGCDGSGKSTLAEEVAELMGPNTRIMHSGPLQGNAVEAYALAFEYYTPGMGRNVICDRLHWGELIYGPLYRGGSALSEAGFRWVEMYLASVGAVAFHVTQDLNVINERLGDRGEDFLQAGHVEFVWNEFKRIAEKSSLTSSVYNVLPGDEEGAAQRIVDIAQYREHMAANIYQQWPGYIGPSVPRALLVGDKRGGQPPYDTRAPFVVKPSSSGTFLLGALDRSWWKEVGIINANEINDFDKLFDALGEPPEIITLGMNAHMAISKYGIEHGAVPHPQYIRRFHNPQQAAYGGLIGTVGKTQEKKYGWPKR